MNSSLIGKIEKARRYAQEPDRVRRIEVAFRGDNDEHMVAFADGVWKCTCHFYEGNGVCSHSMALERMFERVVQATGVHPGAGSPASAR